ncbi:selenocysteine-specific translation elongation factor SelB [Mesocricetibacter intestinalis]|uniref:Selenocysteine-specific elongation factor n=1 Tax=Mesocricetibacter intestinalis TaxID=1521930 RepID=A0A4R6VC74_9PAST|nr:selenocysteine-specific translation elongation factor [Mesocricetibacter intestinalis]TDQ57699.1 selenocysteine-specific translation elongation factor SelB [Mesocricetibacter intestinalis]
MIIVTSGHVDHGKTALLQALTGTDTAHLPEEKQRGMTIDLGYAYLPLQDKILGFIDVPGHEKFLVNMLAGLGGIHYAMLIIAADEGFQPQTREHLTILRLLQIEQIIPVISKADRADTAQIDQLKQIIRQSDPYLAQAPIFVTSAKSGQGIDELRDYLAALPNLSDSTKPFRYAIDRIFTIKGAGTVVTGTAFGGNVEIEDELYLSGGEKVRIKNIHAQNQQNTHGSAGQRLALNINADLDRISIERGDWLFSQKPSTPTERISIRISAETELNENQPVHIYHAAARTTGKLSLLNVKTLTAGQQAVAELILDKPLFLVYGDKLILRSADAKQVIGGAKVIEINSQKRHKRSEERLDLLQKLQYADQRERISLYLQSKAVSIQTLLWTEQLKENQLREILQQNREVCYQEWCFNADYQHKQNQAILAALENYHMQHQDQLGLGKARLYRIAAVNQPEKLIYHFIDLLLEQGKLQQTRGWLHLPEHRIHFSEQELILWQQVTEEFNKQNKGALWVRDLAALLGKEEALMRNFLYKAGKLGYLIPIVKDRFFLTETIYAYAALIKKIIEEQGYVSVNQLRDELQFGRKLTVQLIEYFDRCGFLRRKGNMHTLRDGDIFES